MPRNASGTYTLPSGNPVVSGTLIDATWANNTMADLGNEVTDSLSRSGEGAMLAPLRITDGVQATPSLAFSNEPSSGLYRAGTNEWWSVAAGVQVQQHTSTGAVTRFAAGAVGTPSVSAFNDVNTGIWFPAADTLAVSTAGVEALRVNSSGVLSLVNNPTLSGGTANGVLFLNGSKVATSGSAFVFDGTNVGIGTSSPAYNLDVNTGQIRANETSTGSGDGGLIAGTVGANGNAGVLFQTNGASRWNLTTLGTNGASLRIYNYALASTVATFDSSGNLGIGTTSTGFNSAGLPLVVGSGSGNTGMTIFSGAGSNGSIHFADTVTTGADSYRGIITYSHSNNSMAFYTDATVRATIDSSGNLGLGVTPSLWSTSYRAFEFGSGSLMGRSTNTDIYLLSNSYLNTSGNFVYKSSAAAGYYSQATGAHYWYRSTDATPTAGNTISFTQAMTLDASGNLGVGSTSPSSFDSSWNRLVIGTGSGDAGQAIYSGSASIGSIAFADGTTGAQQYAGLIRYLHASDAMTFWTGATERARITSGGFFKASNTGTYSSSTNDRYEFTSDKNDLTILVNSTNTGANVNNVYSQLPAGANAGAYHFVGSISGSGLQFTVDADGDVKNTNNSYGSISDIKLKQDVVDAASQWDDIKALRVRKYRFKRNPDAALQIGLVAQEAEAVSPGLVEETADRDEEGDDLGTTTKSVKYSVLYMKAVKALQEAMTRIEQLEAKVAALEIH